MAPRTESLIVLFMVLLMGVVYGVDGEDVCQDSLSNCADFDSTTCQFSRPWAEKYCAKFCGICIDNTEQKCPEGWSHFKADQTCIRAFGEYDFRKRLDWEYARKHCGILGGDLVMIRTEEKNTFVYNLFEDKTIVNVWIGIHNVGNTGLHFEYVDGSTISSYHPWLPDNPDNYAWIEYCVTMHVKTDYPGHWNDYDCAQSLPHVCSIPANSN